MASDRLMRLDLSTGRVTRTWPYRHIRSWTVNWDLKQVLVSCEPDTASSQTVGKSGPSSPSSSTELVFQCFTADCKVVHEYIGGYIFLSMRSPDRSQNLNEELFHRLTGGWL